MREGFLLYGDPAEPMEGFWAAPEMVPSGPGSHACVLVAHAWRGQDDVVRERARDLAKLGFVGFALDVYGQGRRAADATQARALMTPLAKDRRLLRERMRQGLEAAQGLAGVDAGRMAAIGYCFGGMCALELARSGAPIVAAVSFHGLLGHGPAMSAPTDQVQARILALHGYDDPMVPPGELLSFCEEMRAARAAFQVHIYGQVAHAFTNPLARQPADGLMYDAFADAHAWQAMLTHLQHCFSVESP